ncbi:NADH:ubiquinone oxidoreductase [Mortierella sp. NVP41]|nr:NADH:ubiquinone oxidoreductase [Mortierella sp. NVP41]
MSFYSPTSSRQQQNSFNNINDELDYYKSHSEAIELELAETKFALEEFQFSSKELEEELEKEIDSTERRYNEIKIRNESMRQEVEEWKEKYHQSIKESNTNINQLTRQLEQLRQQTENFIKKERELEQDNDDLENKGRAAQWSLQELERKYNVALEKQAMLENEVVAKTALSEEVQRLKDELRDTNVELAVMKSNQAALKSSSTASLSSYSGSTSSLADRADRKPAAIGSNEAMPAIRARLAKSGAALRASGATRQPGAGHTPGLGAPHQNPVLMVQEMVSLTGGSLGILSVVGDASVAAASFVLDVYSRFDDAIVASWKSVRITTRISEQIEHDEPTCK